MRTREEIAGELHRILGFICDYVNDGEIIVVPVSGGLDSDVTSRLCAEAVGSENVHLFAVRQAGMEEKYGFSLKRVGKILRPPINSKREANQYLFRHTRDRSLSQNIPRYENLWLYALCSV